MTPLAIEVSGDGALVKLGADQDLSSLSWINNPGVQTIDDCPWRRIFEIWPDPLPALADASIVAVATTNRYEAVATFDRKLANRLESFGLAAYF